MSYRITLAGETHAVAETLIKPHAVEIAVSVLGEQSKKKPETHQLSNNNVTRRIQDLSANV